MEIKELEKKLQDAQERVEKRINTLSKFCKRHNINPSDVYTQYLKVVNDDYFKDYLPRTKREEILIALNIQNEDYSEEISDNLYKLYELEHILFNWKTKLEKEKNKQNVEKIEIIWNFLNEWEVKTLNWYKKNIELFVTLKENEEKSWNEYLTTPEYQENLNYYLRFRNEYNAKSSVESMFKRQYYINVDNFTKQIVKFKYKFNEQLYKSEYDGYEVNTELLEKVISKEKLDKYFDLVNRVTSTVGEIQDANQLSIGEQNGELNGVIIGAKGKVRVETISAGGYNIQRFHYRVLLKDVKE